MPWVLATIAIPAVYFFALGLAYRHGEFSRVYPVARGLGVALAALAGYGSPKASVARPAMWRPIASDAVAAGEGALSTWIA